MAKGRRGVLILAAVMAAAPTVAGGQSMEWSSGAPGGGWFAVASGLAKVITERHPNIKVSVVAGGSLDNPKRIQNGTSQIGMAIDFMAAAARKGEDPFQGNPQDKLRSLGVGWYPSSKMHVVGPADGKLEFMEALTSSGLKIGTTPKGTSEELTLRRILAFYGTSAEEVGARGGQFVTASFTDLARAFSKGTIDYFFGAAALPAPWAAEIVCGGRPARLLALPRDLIGHLTSKLGYRTSKIPEGTYPALQNGEVPVAAIDTVILISADVPAEVAYRITKTLLESRDRFREIHQGLAAFDPKTAWQAQPVPLHPGAERAYREKGFM